jgi:hypothetical protein
MAIKEIEVTGFQIKFKLDGVTRSNLLTVEKFNYGGGSLFQKFKSHVPEVMANRLKEFKDLDIYVSDGLTTDFTFTLVGGQKDIAVALAYSLSEIVAHVHDYHETVNVTIIKRFVAEEVINF